MKTKTLAAMIFAATSISLISCDWLFGKKEKPATALVGTWKIDSMYNTAKDTGKNDTKFLASALGMGKGSVQTIQFKTDSTWKLLQDSSSRWEQYYVKDSALFIREDSVFTSYKMSFIKDSSLLLTDKDSLTTVLKKR